MTETIYLSNPCLECEDAFTCPYIKGELNVEDACLQKLIYISQSKEK